MERENETAVTSERIRLQGMNNTRDLGGMIGAEGRRILPGRLLRSGHFYGASASDLAWIADHVSLAVDFRTAQEVEEKPDPAIPGVELLQLPAFGSLAAGVSRDEESNETAFAIVSRDPEKARAYMLRTYRGFVTTPFTVAQYRRFLQLLSQPRDKALLFHCTAGKDRTGFAAVLIETLLGVEREAVVQDYLDTGAWLAEEIKALNEMVGRRMGGLDARAEEALSWLFGVHAEYLAAVYRQTEEDYGSFDAFLTSALGMDEAARAALREQYLE